MSVDDVLTTKAKNVQKWPSSKESFLGRPENALDMKAENVLKWKPKNSNIKKIIVDEIRWIRFFSKRGIVRKFKNYF